MALRVVTTPLKQVQLLAFIEMASTWMGLSVVSDPLFWRNTIMVPAYACMLSITVHFLRIAIGKTPLKGIFRPATAVDLPFTPEGLFQRHVEKPRGPSILLWRISRVFACAILLIFQVCTVVSAGSSDKTPRAKTERWHGLLLIGSYLYTLLLAIASVACAPACSKIVVRHLASVLLVIWGTFAYRNLYPLATYTAMPADASEGAWIWMKLIVLSFVAVLLPLCTPRIYVPIDPRDPDVCPSLEHTASILALVLYTFLDQIVWLGYRKGRLDWDDLPPLADTDKIKNVVRKGSPHLDPLTVQKRRHIFFGLVATFHREYSVMSLMLILRTITTFIVPLGIYRLLNYLSATGAPDDIRPWVWIIWLALGPVINQLPGQYYTFVATRVRVQAPATLTQLVFEHALKMRVAETELPAPGVLRSVEATRADQRKLPKPLESTSAIGRLNSLVSADLQNIPLGNDFLYVVLYVPLQVSLCIWFLYAVLGWSAFVGLLIIIIMFPFPGYIAKHLQAVQVQKMMRTDARVQVVVETMNVIRMIKMFGWEQRTKERIARKRKDELTYVKRFKLLVLSNSLFNLVIPVLTMVATFVVFVGGLHIVESHSNLSNQTLIMKRQLTAAIVFSSMSVFQLFQDNLRRIFGQVPQIIQAKVSLDRINAFLYEAELLDISVNSKTFFQRSDALVTCQMDPETICVRDARFTWSRQDDGTASTETSEDRSTRFTLHVKDLTFKSNSINLILGPTGSGKTSLLMALLGEMYYDPTSSNSYVNLPRHTGVAYAAQESWIQNASIQDNILFGAPYDERRYKQVIHQCALGRDLELFEAGDKTEVGERGVTLSGGQKARVTLARAIYSSAKIVLLDDTLAALDVHTSRWIVNKCLQGNLLLGRTVLLATHNVHSVMPVASLAISLDSSGGITYLDLSNISLENSTLDMLESASDAEVVLDLSGVPAAKRNADGGGKLTTAEELSERRVEWPAIKLFFASLWANSPIAFWMLFIVGMGLNCFIDTSQAWYMGYWAQQYEIRDPSKINVTYYVGVYILLLLTLLAVFTVASSVFVYGSMTASTIIHERLMASVLSATLRWLDRTPASRIISRCTQDIQTVDGSIGECFMALSRMTLSMLAKFIAILVVSPSFALPGIVMAVLGTWCGQVYMKSQLSAKRMTSNAQAPVLAHFGAIISGLTSIRAYGAQEAFRQELYRRIDRFSRSIWTSQNLDRWVNIRMEVLSGMFSASLATYLVYWNHISASNTGFSLNMAVGFSSMILWWIRTVNDFEVNSNSLERIYQYTEIEQEPKSAPEGVPPAHWPSSGELTVQNLHAQYSQDGPGVLRDISFHVQAGERVGIVGRTGSGKSSLILSLLRCILTTGTIIYDGLPIDSVNLDALRSNITTIPQAPELLSGTLRHNLDPFEEHDDATLHDALRAAGLYSLHPTSRPDDVEGLTSSGRMLALDTMIAGGGDNLSVGQRQIIALARAFLRRSKLLILDEATSAIDYETDGAIQASLRTQLSADTTVLIVAHRLQTVMDADKIMVLDAGRLVEFDSPHRLLKKADSLFKALVDESGDRERLYTIAMEKGDSHPEV